MDDTVCVVSITFSANPPRLLLVGAGSRSATLARSIVEASNGLLVAGADPDPGRCQEICRHYISKSSEPGDRQEFDDWREFLEWEVARRRKQPLATSLDDCSTIAHGLGVGLYPGDEGKHTGFSTIGHVLRYAPINRTKMKLICEDHAIGEIVSIDHSESVGWWHFAHSYVRASGALMHFRRARKPGGAGAGAATNCLSCLVERSCIFSAKKIYNDMSLKGGIPRWPMDVVVPEIEDLLDVGDIRGVEEVLMDRISEDSTTETPKEVVGEKQWYGRCVYEADSNVCDDQTIRFTWEDSPLLPDEALSIERIAKRATLHMTAFGEGVCTKRTKIYGTKGEIESNGRGHSGGDYGLMRRFVLAIDAVKTGMEDIIRSHAMVFAAEDARKTRSVVDWDERWKTHILRRTSKQ
ncbi:hypothetical protein BJX99DRAFT_248235 [Aspergillus californicus]